MAFYDFDEYERLVAAAWSMDASTLLIVLLGGEAGLRCGEMIAFEWRDVDLGKRQCRLVQKSLFRKVADTTQSLVHLARPLPCHRVVGFEFTPCGITVVRAKNTGRLWNWMRDILSQEAFAVPPRPTKVQQGKLTRPPTLLA